jgi:hypothetical protein
MNTNATTPVIGTCHHHEAVERVVEDRSPQDQDLDGKQDRDRDAGDALHQAVEALAAPENEGVLEEDVHQHVRADRYDASEGVHAPQDEVEAVAVERDRPADRCRLDRHAVNLCVA